MGRQYCPNDQYARRETIGIIGILHNPLEDTVRNVFRKFSCNIDKNDIKGCHWLKDNKRVIAKFA